ncbi:MAG: DUF6252 family protein [Salibacteraceae bacterium]
MKLLKSVLSLSVLVGGLTFLGSCDKTTDEIIEDITPAVTASVDGNPFSTEIAAGLHTTLLLITATKDKESIVLSLPAKDVGVYPVDILTTNASYLPVLDSLNSAYIAYEGQIEITSINTLRTQIQGKFYFKAANPNTLDTLSVTDGILKNIPIK